MSESRTKEYNSDECEELVRLLRGFTTSYPERAFPPLTEEETSKHGALVTRASAHMGRHLSQFMAQGADAIEVLSNRLSETARERDEALEALRVFDPGLNSLNRNPK